jgi:hypothetical protein
MDTKKILMYIVIAIVLMWLYKQYWFEFKQWITGSDLSNPAGEEGISESRKNELKDIASDVYYDIENRNFYEHISSPYKRANNLNDEELKYSADHYKKILTGGKFSMRYDIDTQWYPTFNDANRLSVRLKSIGKS